MDRIPDARWREPIGKALQVTNQFNHHFGHVQFVCGVDPNFAGIHNFKDKGGVPYNRRAHCCYPSHLSGPADRRVTTIVLPRPVPPNVVVHELGHALHEVVNFRSWPNPVTEYAKTNAYEAFAEAFRAFHYYYGDESVAKTDHKTLALFNSLSSRRPV